MEPRTNNPDIRHKKRMIIRFRQYGVVACMIVMAAGLVIGLLFFARPDTSASERRPLTAYPEFTTEGFLDGSYFTDVALWYADTYPLREPMVGASKAIKKLYGLSGSSAVVNANVRADDIPVAPTDGAVVPPVETLTTPVPQQEKPAADAEAETGFAAVADAEAEAEATAETTVETTVEPEPQLEKPSIDEDIPWGRNVDEAVQNSIMNGLYIKDGTAYSICYFSQTGADLYVAAANELAQQLDGTAHVYSMLVPSSAILLPQEEYDSVGGSDQRQVLDYVWARFDDNVTHVDLLDTMLEHSDGYPFFRTDHHWTMRGAYYGYVEYCKARGIKPASLDSFEYRDMGEFAGSFYDTIVMYGDADIDDFETFTPAATNAMVRRSADWVEVNDEIVEDSSDWDIYGKYDSLSGCDPASGTIHNPKIHDGSAVLVVKDSYGSAFIPFLVANYEYVHMIDTRIYEGAISDYVRDNSIQDVILCYGIKVGLDDQFAYLLYSCIADEY